MIKITKKDIIWNYAGSIINLGMNVFILPFVLRMLSTEELGLWYVFVSISSLVSLLDFGFSPSIMRNIIYAWSGATKLNKEGMPEIGLNNEPNYRLMLNLISASKKIYLLISILASLILLFLGTPYIIAINNHVYNEYLISWIIYSFGICLNLYYSYWNPLLKGIGAIKESNQVQVFSKALYIIITIIGLYFKGGLVWLSFTYLISGLLMRILSKICFRRVTNINEYSNVDKQKIEIKDILKTIWPNAKKQGLVTVGAWLITRSTTLISSYFYGLDITAQLGLSLQLFGFIGGLSTLLFNSYSPELASLKISGNNHRFKIIFARSISFQWLISIIGYIGVIFIAPSALNLIGSNSVLLPRNILIVLGIILMLEWNHSTFATLITLSNRVPFLASSLLSGAGIVVLSLVLANLTDLGVLGLVLSQGFTQLIYNNWYWPRLVCLEMKVNFLGLLKDGLYDISKVGINANKRFFKYIKK